MAGIRLNENLSSRRFDSLQKCIQKCIAYKSAWYLAFSSLHTKVHGTWRFLVPGVFFLAFSLPGVFLVPGVTFFHLERDSHACGCRDWFIDLRTANLRIYADE